jgi:hypothetical protein
MGSWQWGSMHYSESAPFWRLDEQVAVISRQPYRLEEEEVVHLEFSLEGAVLEGSKESVEFG